MNYIYRAITANDLNNINNKEDIEAPKLRYGFNYRFEDYLYEIPTHILSGNTKTMWISLSKDYDVCYKKYSNNGNHDSNVRNHVIAVKFDKPFSLTTSEYNEDLFMQLYQDALNMNVDDFHRHLNMIYDLHPLYINKVIIDLSTKESIQILSNFKLIKSKYKENPNYGYTISNYTSSDKEVLMFKNIKYKDIEYNLSPLEMDILYAISNIEDIDFHRDLEKIKNIKTFVNTCLNNIEKYNYFDILYIQNLTATGYYDICKLTNRNVFSIVNEYINIKKELLKNIILNYYLFNRQLNNINKILNYGVPIIENEQKIYEKELYNCINANKEFENKIKRLI